MGHDDRSTVSGSGIRAATLLFIGAFGAASVTFSTQLLAQASPGAVAKSDSEAGKVAGLEEVVVTAQRKSENLQKVPIAVEAFDQSALEKANVSNIADLKAIAPSLNYMAEAAWAQPTLRGIGTAATGPGIESAVATYIDGVYQASMIGGASDFNNVKAVEVINGPQGTLFGRNATGGLIQIRTLDPSHTFGGSLSAGYGNFDTASANAYVTGGLTDTIAADLALDFDDEIAGYGRNLIDGRNINKELKAFARSKILFTPTDDTRFTFSGNYGRVNFDPIIFNVPGSTPIGGLEAFDSIPPHDATSPYNSSGHVVQYGGSLTSEVDFHPLRFLSITAYEGTDASNLFGTVIANPLVTSNLLLVEPHRQFSQEFQLSSPNEGILTWTTGLYYFHEAAYYDPVHLYGPLYFSPFFPLTDIFYHTTSKTDSYAAYAQGTLALQEDTHLTMGFRYTTEKRSISIVNDLVGIDPVSGTPGIPLGTVSTAASKNFHAPTWRVALDHNFSSEILGYVSYNRGFKSGGFNPAQLPALDYKPEKLDAYEVGLKTQTVDHRVRLNVAGFWYSYSQIQVESFANQILLISNGAKARMQGIDADLNAAVTSNFTAHLGASFLHARFTDYPHADKTTPVPFDPANPFSGGNTYSFEDATGHPVPRAPDFMLSTGGTYTIPMPTGDIDLNLNYNYNSGWNAEADGRLKQKAYSVVDARATWTSPDKRWQVDFWGKNLTDTDYALTMFSQQAYDEQHWAPPRTFGLTGKLRFGGGN